MLVVIARGGGISSQVDEEEEIALTGLQFPDNDDANQSTYAVLEFEDPQDDGLPFNGPDSGGWTIIWEYEPKQQTGYYVTWWWSNGTDGASFLWDSGSSNTYVGCHPYPPGGASGTDHNWELAGLDSGADNQNTRAGSPKAVVKDVQYLQAFTMVDNGATLTGTFYTELPSTDDEDVIERTSPSGWGQVDPPTPAFTFGDSPWHGAFQQERLSGILGRVKIFAPRLSEADILSESADMSQLVTANGQARIWYGKNGYTSNNDLTCDYGTGRSFVRVDASNLITKVDL